MTNQTLQLGIAALDGRALAGVTGGYRAVAHTTHAARSVPGNGHLFAQAGATAGAILGGFGGIAVGGSAGAATTLGLGTVPGAIIGGVTGATFGGIVGGAAGGWLDRKTHI